LRAVGGDPLPIVEGGSNAACPTGIWTVALAIGAVRLSPVFQASRSGATILVARWARPAREAAEFSFLIGIPAPAAAAKESYDALKHPPAWPIDWGMIALGMLVSAVTAFIAVKWLLRYVQTHTFNGFGIYRVVLGLAILAIVVH
jgi:undecaprenyl-diphosphatase